MRYIIPYLLLISVTTRVHAQSPDSLTLDYCYQRAYENYPLVQQRDLIEKTRDYSVSNAQKGIIPTVTLNAQQSYQSDVTRVPVAPDPALAVPVISKNQYKVYGDVVANLYNGGNIHLQKEMHEANARIDEQKLEVELYKLKERVNQLYFGILLIDGQLQQNDLLRQNVIIGLKKVQASIAGGTALKSSADVLQAELLKTEQRRIELVAARQGYQEALSLLLGVSLSDSTSFQKPEPLTFTEDIRRPELSLYTSQQSLIDVQTRMLQSRNTPRLSSFLQVGYGRPGLNMLNPNADSYYIAGFRFSWNITSFYTFKKDKEILQLNRQNINLQQETFLFNTQYTLRQQRAEVRKLDQLLATDDELIALRMRIKNTASSQLENGVIDSSDYLREVNAEDQARQNKTVHEIQYLLAQYTQQTTNGK